jgi:Prolyl oligopeptidase family
MNYRLLLATLLCLPVWADGPKDNQATTVRPVPPPGLPVPPDVQQGLETSLKALRLAIDTAAKTQAKHPLINDLLPDVEVYYKAVDWALRHHEFFKPEDFKTAVEQLAEGMDRATQLAAGKTPWTKQTGLVVRGYRSRIDGSVQPYGMVIPEDGFSGLKRLDIWCHGRFENVCEMQFMQQRRKQAGQAQAPHTLVLHPYGRFSCANKFAGEIDTLEALAHAQKFYSIDEDRIIMRGFSMGGAAAWQFAVHYSDLWCGANPGAGFCETPEFLRVFQNEDVDSSPWYQKQLWRWYNCTDTALNLWHCPTVAYSGELDKQKQAADMMEAALRGEQIDLLHIIGPQTAHKIHPDSMVEIERRLANIAAAGRDRCPDVIHFTTWTLRYPKMHWVTVDSLESHWTRCRIHADARDSSNVVIKTQNCTALTLDMPSGYCRLSPINKVPMTIDSQKLTVSRPKLDRSWLVRLRRVKGQWQEEIGPDSSASLAKQHGLTGPIDDAFMDAFLFVKPTGTAWNDKVATWSEAERTRASFEWRRQFRGDAPMKDDTAITDADIANNNLVLWGDPGSNSVLAKLLAKLPIEWSKDTLKLNGQSHTAAGHAPILIYPNPLNPKRYIVINSGFTYREYDYLNNARQGAKLPDWAAVDLSIAPDTQNPGKIADAGFFDEAWQWKKSTAKPVK